MSVSAPFSPSGNTVVFAAATSAPTPVQAISSTLGGNQYRVINSGTVIAYLRVGNTSANATANAVVVSTTASSIPLLPGTDEILTFTPNAYFTGITSTSSANVYITPGDGD